MTQVTAVDYNDRCPGDLIMVLARKPAQLPPEWTQLSQQDDPFLIAYQASYHPKDGHVRDAWRGYVDYPGDLIVYTFRNAGIADTGSARPR